MKETEHTNPQIEEFSERESAKSELRNVVKHYTGIIDLIDPLGKEQETQTSELSNNTK